MGGNPASFSVTIAWYVAAVPRVGVPLINSFGDLNTKFSPGGSAVAVQL